jgi:GMP synthase-like glutamine amidotransferase
MKITGLTRRLRAQAGPHDDKALAYSSRNVRIEEEKLSGAIVTGSSKMKLEETEEKYDRMSAAMGEFPFPSYAQRFRFRTEKEGIGRGYNKEAPG